MSDQSGAPSFENDIQQLFRDKDRARMEWAFDLWNYEDVKNNARFIRVSGAADKVHFEKVA